MNVTITGVEGQIRWSYHSAAVLRAWTVVSTDTARTLTASVVSQDTYRVSQRPLVFVAPHAKGEWHWPVEELQIQDGALTACLGPQKA